MEADPFARARILFEQSRYDLAEHEVRAALGVAPDDPDGYILLSLCQSGRGDAGGSETARRAIELSPNEARAHFALGRAQIARGDLDGAEASFRRAIELQPWQSGYFGSLAAVQIARCDWTAALASADSGLALDPEDDVCLNNRAMALTNLGRRAEAAATLEGGLAKNPEDPFSHANRGWSLLHENDPRRAAGHFREALRLDPHFAWAKQGLLEALRATNWFYRRVLQFFLLLSRFPPRLRLALVLGLFFVVRLLGNVGKAYPALEPYCLVLLLTYVAFVAATWFAPHAMNAVLLTGRDGRMLLDRTQMWVSATCVLLALAAFGGTAYALVQDDGAALPVAVFLFVVGVHVGSAFGIASGRYRWYGLAASIGILAFGAYVTAEDIEIADMRAALRRDLRRFDEAEKFVTTDVLALVDPPEKERRLKDMAYRELALRLLTVQIRSRNANVDFDRNLFVFGGVGALLWHAVLVRKAGREIAG